MTDKNKPPLGASPEWVPLRDRSLRLLEALERYLSSTHDFNRVDLLVPWVEELRRHVDRIGEILPPKKFQGEFLVEGACLLENEDCSPERRERCLELAGGARIHDVSHPGSMLREWLQENELEVAEFAGRTNFDGDGPELGWSEVGKIVDEVHPITLKNVGPIAEITKIPAHVWLAMQHHYDQEKQHDPRD